MFNDGPSFSPQTQVSAAVMQSIEHNVHFIRSKYITAVLQRSRHCEAHSASFNVAQCDLKYIDLLNCRIILKQEFIKITTLTLSASEPLLMKKSKALP